jgi:hypothetical protein
MESVLDLLTCAPSVKIWEKVKKYRKANYRLEPLLSPLIALYPQSHNTPSIDRRNTAQALGHFSAAL